LVCLRLHVKIWGQVGMSLAKNTVNCWVLVFGYHLVHDTIDLFIGALAVEELYLLMPEVPLHWIVRLSGHGVHAVNQILKFFWLVSETSSFLCEDCSFEFFIHLFGELKLFNELTYPLLTLYRILRCWLNVEQESTNPSCIPITAGNIIAKLVLRPYLIEKLIC